MLTYVRTVCGCANTSIYTCKSKTKKALIQKTVVLPIERVP